MVTIYPYVEANPYQTMLTGALEKQGCEVARLRVINDRFPVRLLSECRNSSVVHFHWIEHLYQARTLTMTLMRTAVLLWMLICLRIRGTRIVYTLHNLLPHDSQRRTYDLFIQKLLVTLSDVTIVHSQAALSLARKTFGEKANYEIISHGRYDGFYVNEVSRSEARLQCGVPEHARVALFFGSMRGYKGLGRLLECAGEFARRGITLLVAGESTGLTVSERELLTAAHENVVLHRGYVPISHVQYFMNAADCLMLPYSDSLTSGAAFLALSFRLPIVATDAVAFKEMIKWKLGAACDPSDARGVADAIEKVCSWDRSQFSDRCECFLSNCEWDDIGCKHLVAYDLK